MRNQIPKGGFDLVWIYHVPKPASHEASAQRLKATVVIESWVVLQVGQLTKPEPWQLSEFVTPMWPKYAFIFSFSVQEWTFIFFSSLKITMFCFIQHTFHPGLSLCKVKTYNAADSQQSTHWNSESDGGCAYFPITWLIYNVTPGCVFGSVSLASPLTLQTHCYSLHISARHEWIFNSSQV